MRARGLSEIAAAVGGRLEGEDATVTSAAVDSRRVEPGALFVALRGERLDGHDFVAEARAAGAGAALVERASGGEPSVVVSDTGEALLGLASSERASMAAKVVGVTGANGKTSTKDLASAMLASRFRVHASPVSFNNEVGLPLTVLGAPSGVEILVAEMGARRLGDAARLCDVARPDVVVITNAGVAHMEVFGSWENIVAATAEPLEFLGEDGVAVLCSDDRVVAGLAERTRAQVVTFGVGPDADVRAEDVGLGEDGRAAFDLAASGERESVELAVPGEHMVLNALAAAACGLTAGMTVAECAAGLKGARISAWRMETFVSGDGIKVLNDAYNANPESMAAGLKTARWMSRGGRMIAVLGHMAELGPIAGEEHERIGELIARLGVDRLVTVGEPARAIARAAVREGMEPENVADVAGAGEALADVRARARRGDLVLVKGSRVVGLEKLAEALR